MAKRRRKTRKRRTRKCKVVTVCGRRRRLCWSAKGKIVSNTPAGRGGRRRKSTKKRKSRKSNGRRCRFGVVKSGRRKGQCLKNKRARR